MANPRFDSGQEQVAGSLKSFDELSGAKQYTEFLD